jgi:threonine synthase
MRYISTRGTARSCSFEEALLSGLASDGGLLEPECWPGLARSEIKATTPYIGAACSILSRFVGESFSADELRADVESAYATFDTPEIAPLVQIGEDRYLLELFHGPTLAFKDVAMQVLGRLFERVLDRANTRATIIAATSGDTGSAAIAALGGLSRIELFVLHPHGRVSEVQRRQMTTAPHGNVHNIAIEGTFDDAQNIVKSLFADEAFAREARLAAVNSINFARIAAQSVYYFTAAAKFSRPAVFVVPTGNFGDVFAGEAAMRMGLEVERLIIATNANDILCRALRDGVYAIGSAQPTLSPSMDIQVASNFERALFEASGRDTTWTRTAMAEFVGSRRLDIPAPILEDIRHRYAAIRCDDTQTLATITRIHRETGRLIDPHTAVGIYAATFADASSAGPVIVLATAHAAKFPEAVRKATGIAPPLPPRLSDLYEREERLTVLPNDRAQVRALIEQRLARL